MKILVLVLSVMLGASGAAAKSVTLKDFEGYYKVQKCSGDEDQILWPEEFRFVLRGDNLVAEVEGQENFDFKAINKGAHEEVDNDSPSKSKATVEVTFKGNMVKNHARVTYSDYEGYEIVEESAELSRGGKLILRSSLESNFPEYGKDLTKAKCVYKRLR